MASQGVAASTGRYPLAPQDTLLGTAQRLVGVSEDDVEGASSCVICGGLIFAASKLKLEDSPVHFHCLKEFRQKDADIKRAVVPCGHCGAAIYGLECTRPNDSLVYHWGCRHYGCDVSASASGQSQSIRLRSRSPCRFFKADRQGIECLACRARELGKKPNRAHLQTCESKRIYRKRN